MYAKDWISIKAFQLTIYALGFPDIATRALVSRVSIIHPVITIITFLHYYHLLKSFDPSHVLAFPSIFFAVPPSLFSSFPSSDFLSSTFPPHTCSLPCNSILPIIMNLLLPPHSFPISFLRSHVIPRTSTSRVKIITIWSVFNISEYDLLL